MADYLSGARVTLPRAIGRVDGVNDEFDRVVVKAGARIARRRPGWLRGRIQCAHQGCRSERLAGIDASPLDMRPGADAVGLTTEG